MAKKKTEIEKIKSLVEIKEDKKSFRIRYKNKKRYYAVFMIKDGEGYEVLKRKQFKPDIDVLRYKVGNSHIIDISKKTYSKGLNIYFLIDIKQGQLYFKGSDTISIKPQVVDMICKGHVIKDITARFDMNSFKKNWGLWTMLLIFGALLGFVIRGFF